MDGSRHCVLTTPRQCERRGYSETQPHSVTVRNMLRPHRFEGLAIADHRNTHCSPMALRDTHDPADTRPSVVLLPDHLGYAATLPSLVAVASAFAFHACAQMCPQY
jgi:hypothetical protein